MTKDYRVYTTSGGMSGLLPNINKKYEALLKQLHGPDLEISNQDFSDLLWSSSERVLFLMSNDQLVATAQATLAITPPVRHVYINNVVVEETLRGQGWGKVLEKELTRVVKESWKKDNQIIRMELTNSPKKENARFYLSCGWKTRGPSSRDPTVVWVKHI